MSNQFNILFCDDESRRHRDFLGEVVAKMRANSFGVREYKIFHSQSLMPVFEGKYSDFCKARGAKSVENWIQDSVKFDLVITDLNFVSAALMGSEETGFKILETIDERASERWTKYILLTAQKESVKVERYIELAQKKLLNTQNFIEFSKVASEKNWKTLLERAEDLIKVIEEQRQKDLATVADYSDENLYDVHIYYRDSPADQANPLGVVIKEKGDGGAAIKFKLGVAGYIFRALLKAQKSGRPFIRLKDLIELTNKMASVHKARGMDAKTFDESPIKSHVNRIRNLIRQNEVKLNYDHPEIERTGSFHRKTHKPGVFCADCIIQRGEKEPLKGYRLAATLKKVRRVKGKDDEDFDEIFLNEDDGEIIGI